MPEASHAYIEFSRKILPVYTWRLSVVECSHAARFLAAAPARPVLLSDGLFVICMAAVAAYGFSGASSAPICLVTQELSADLWLTPHAMIYDWAILIIPAVLLWLNASADWKGIYALYGWLLSSASVDSWAAEGAAICGANQRTILAIALYWSAKPNTENEYISGIARLYTRFRIFVVD